MSMLVRYIHGTWQGQPACDHCTCEQHTSNVKLFYNTDSIAANTMRRHRPDAQLTSVKLS